MGALTLVEKDADCQGDINWPLFYMNDFSVMGLRVESLVRALEVLEADGYHVVRKKCSAKVKFGNTGRFKNIFKTLQRHCIAHDMSDLAHCAYQG